MGPHKHFHISKIYGDWSWSIGFGLTHENCFGETYIWVNFFKWMFCFGKLANLKLIEEQNEEN